jgi:flavin-dependent dehydrogenase
VSFPLPWNSFKKIPLRGGESAGQVKTITGGGVCWEQNCGVEAFSKGDFCRKTLSEYEKRWKGVFGEEIFYGECFHRLYSKLDDKAIASLFDTALDGGLLSFIA